MKIAILQDDFPPHAKGGAGIVAAAYARALAKFGHEVVVITAVQDQQLEGSFFEAGIRVERIYSSYMPRWRAWRSLYNPSVVNKVRALFAEVSPQIVHAHNVHYHLSYWSLRLAKKSGAVVFLTAHDVMLFHYGKLSEFVRPEMFTCEAPRNYKVHWWEQLKTYRFWYNPFRNVCIRYALQSVDQIFAVSEALREALSQNGVHATTFHNGIDTTAFDVNAKVLSRTREQWHLQDKFVVLFGGRLSGLKGAEVVIDSMRRLASVHSHIKLLILGERDAYATWLAECASDLAERITFTGWVSGAELKTALHIADVIVAPSQYLDPLPTIVLEGMACGKPVIGSCLGGIPEMVSDGRTGFIINPFSSEEIAARIAALVEDRTLCELFGKQGKAYVSARFDLHKQTARLENEYRRALSFNYIEQPRERGHQNARNHARKDQSK